MTDAPKQIWTDYFMANKLFLAFSDPPVNEFNDCRDEYILAAEHERIVAEARNRALEEVALYIEQRDGSIPCRQEIASAIRAMKD